MGSTLEIGSKGGDPTPKGLGQRLAIASSVLAALATGKKGLPGPQKVGKIITQNHQI